MGVSVCEIRQRTRGGRGQGRQGKKEVEEEEEKKGCKTRHCQLVVPQVWYDTGIINEHRPGSTSTNPAKISIRLLIYSFPDEPRIPSNPCFFVLRPFFSSLFSSLFLASRRFLLVVTQVVSYNCFGESVQRPSASQPACYLNGTYLPACLPAYLPNLPIVPSLRIPHKALA